MSLEISLDMKCVKDVTDLHLVTGDHHERLVRMVHDAHVQVLAGSQMERGSYFFDTPGGRSNSSNSLDLEMK